MSLALQDLSPLLESQGDHFVAGAALEVDFSANGLRDKDIPFDGREFERSLVGTLHKELRACGEDTQCKVGRQRIAADIVCELRFRRCPFARDRHRRAQALDLQNATTLKPNEGVCSVRFALRPQSGLELERLEVARTVVAHYH